MLNSIFRGLLGTEEAPTKVIEVRSDNYISRPIHYREDSMLLYGPKNPPDGKNTKEKYYEIVLHKPFTESLHQMYSLFRAKTLESAEEKFIVYKERIPIFIKITKECTVAILQKLCDTLSEHQSWTIAHMVAHFGLSELFNDPEVQKHIDSIDPLTGATPLMVAVKSCNVRMVQSLVSLNSSLDVIDLEGNTVFHYAAASNKEIINALASKSPSSLNVYNKQGYTPLHTACLADAPDCVRALMLAGADVNLTAAKRSTSLLPGIVGDLLHDNQPKLYQQDMKHGGTPIHWAISREVIEALVDKNCDINALNFDGRTALHIMVLRGRLECAMALLSRGAEHSIGDNEGNTPLHLAVKQTNIAIVQALIVFGADLEAKNNMGNTARHILPTEMSSSNYDKILYVLHAVGARRCPPEVSGCGPGCSARGDYNGVPPPPVARSSTRDLVSQMLSVAAMERAACYDTNQKQGRLLCLDGGGIRGLVLVQVLINLEEAVGQPIIHCFDWIAGTSTGGILALALASGKSLRDCQRLYFRMKEFAFVGMRPYPSEALETILKDCLGTETVMADIEHPKLMILAVLADRKPVDLHIFRNYKSAQEILDDHNGTTSPHAEAGDQASVVSLAAPPPPAEQLVWQAARATGAAPSYFRASGRYLDGGLMGNNPTLDVLTELTELNLALRATGQHEEAKKTNLKVVVSCGTGLIPVSKLKDIDVFKPESLWDTARLAWGLSAIGGLLVDQKPPANCCEWLRTFFDTRYVKETLVVAFKKGPNNRRLRVIMLVVVMCVIIGPIYGEMSVLYLFTRYRFNWNEVDYSMFSTYAMCTSLVGTLFSVGVFSHLLKFDDAIIGVISCTSKILAGIMYAFATKTWHIYIAPLIEVFNGTSFIAMRSMVSKLVDKHELGKVNSFFGVAEAMMPLIYAPMYTTVYTATIKTFPGAFFLLGGALTMPAVVIFLWLYLANKKQIQANLDKEAELGANAEKTGLENKAYETDEVDKKTNANTTDDKNDVIVQSQIEMGFIESMVNNSKVQL